MWAIATLGVRDPESSGSVPFRPVLSSAPQTLAPDPVVPLAVRLPADPATDVRTDDEDEVVALAERYDSADCRNAIDKESAWDHLCGGKRASHNPLCLKMQQKYLKMPTSSTEHRFREVLYVRNQKAASQLWVREFANMLGIEGPFPGLRRASNLKAPNGTFVFSFVREPLQTALDGALRPAPITFRMSASLATRPRVPPRLSRVARPSTPRPLSARFAHGHTWPAAFGRSEPVQLGGPGDERIRRLCGCAEAARPARGWCVACLPAGHKAWACRQLVARTPLQRPRQGRAPAERHQRDPVSRRLRRERRGGVWV